MRAICRKSCTSLGTRYLDRIVASVHVHIDEDNCLEVIILKGETGEVQDVANLILGTKGVKTGRLVMTTTGEFI